MEGSICVYKRQGPTGQGINNDGKNRKMRGNELIDPVKTHRPIIQSHLDRIFATRPESVPTRTDRDGIDRFINLGIIVSTGAPRDEKIRIHPCRRGVIDQLE
jgi:hypothetical protein